MLCGAIVTVIRVFTSHHSSLITHHIITHHITVFTSHHSSLITPHITSHHSSLITHHSSLITHHSSHHSSHHSTLITYHCFFITHHITHHSSHHSSHHITHKQAHNPPALLTPHHALRPVHHRNLLLHRLRFTRPSLPHVVRERRHEHARRDLRFVQHVVGLWHHAHRRTHEAVAAVARVLEHVLVGRERDRLRVKETRRIDPRVIIIGGPPHVTQVIIFLGVRDAI